MPYARFEKPAQDAAGNLLTDIWCEVRREEVAGNPLEPLFADRLGAVPLENPFFTPSGIPAFHAAGGAYRVRYYKAGFDETYRYQAVGIGAENDLQGFIPMGSWDDETLYAIGDVVTHPDGGGTLHLFASKVNDNIDEEPTTSPAPEESGFWAYIGLAIPGPRGEGLRFDAQVNLLSGRDAYDGAAEGFALLVSNIGDGRAAIYVMGDGGSGDWSAPSYVTGPVYVPADGSIANAKLANMANATIKGRSSGGSGAPEDLTMAAVLALLIAADGIREKLTANRTYYVRTDGSDSNNGLANTAGGAFLTIQKAIDVAATLDVSIYGVTIQVGNGTYTLSSPLSLKSAVGSGGITIQGDNSTPSNVVIQGSGISLFVTAGGLSTPYTLTGMQSQITASGSGSSHVIATAGTVTVNNWIFTGASAPFAYMLARGGRINGQTFTVSAGATWMARADNGGASFLNLANFTATMSGTPAWGSGCVGVANGAAAIVYGKTWTGAATGKRYDATLNGSIDAAGGGASFLPGNAAGTTATGGQYA